MHATGENFRSNRILYLDTTSLAIFTITQRYKFLFRFSISSAFVLKRDPCRQTLTFDAMRHACILRCKI